MNTSQDPSTHRVSDLIAQAYQALYQQEATQAMSYVLKALALRPREAKCHRLAGEIYKRMGKDMLAQRAFANATTLDPEGKDIPAGPAKAVAPSPSAAGPPSALKSPPPSKPGMPQGSLTPQQRQALANQAGQCLNKVVLLERRLNEVAPGGGEVNNLVKHERLKLMQLLREVRLPPTPTPAAASFAQPGLPQAIPAEYQAMPAFTQTLGPIAGALTMGPPVAHLQRLLTMEGFTVPATGRYDRATTQALQQLQGKYGLAKRDGIVGGETRRLLNKLIGKDSPLAALSPRKPAPGIKLGETAQRAFDRLLGH